MPIADQNTIILSRSATESIAEGDTSLAAYYRNRAEERLSSLIRWDTTCIRSERARPLVGAAPLTRPVLVVNVVDADGVIVYTAK